MKQGMTRKLAPKDKHTKASWKKRDEGRKGRQEAYVAPTEYVIEVLNTTRTDDWLSDGEAEMIAIYDQHIGDPPEDVA